MKTQELIKHYHDLMQDASDLYSMALQLDDIVSVKRRLDDADSEQVVPVFVEVNGKPIRFQIPIRYIATMLINAKQEYSFTLKRHQELSEGREQVG